MFRGMGVFHGKSINLHCLPLTLPHHGESLQMDSDVPLYGTKDYHYGPAKTPRNTFTRWKAKIGSTWIPSAMSFFWIHPNSGLPMLLVRWYTAPMRALPGSGKLSCLPLTRFIPCLG